MAVVGNAFFRIYSKEKKESHLINANPDLSSECTEAARKTVQWGLALRRYSVCVPISFRRLCVCLICVNDANYLSSMNATPLQI